ncbi:MAG: glutamine--fructose-6-phosphate transaminase (isomerizing) [Patescibacteria group bacterium]|nr:glutamine--fructose-6-phosphate transaminase (isomerizing) [Patescibacteria group bacterium]
MIFFGKIKKYKYMCGIIGYLGKQDNIKIGMTALKKLEYRGYDSAGFATYIPEKKEIICLKSIGKINSLEQKILKSNLDFKGSPSIFHTRWATTGIVSEENAHPHCDCKRNIFLVHNGIVENYKEIKEQLLREGHNIVSETDSEIIAHLIEKFFKGILEEAVAKALKIIKGTYALIVISQDDPEKIVCARLSSPLIIGKKGNEYLIASDPIAISLFSKKFIELNDNEIAVITAKKFFIIKDSFFIKNRKPKKIGKQAEEIKKGEYSHFMLKEIFEEPEAIRRSIKGHLSPNKGLVRFGGMEIMDNKLKEIEKIIIVACGTAYYAGLTGKYMLEEYAKIPVEVEVASEFRYRNPIINKKTAVLAISQSGETADTLAAIREAKKKGALTLGVVNIISSSIAREVDAGIYNHIGQEVAVASTKAFISQLVILALFTLYLSKENLSLGNRKEIIENILELPKLVEGVLKQNSKIKILAKKYSKFSNFFYLGRKYSYPVAMEGALKLKEVSYIHAEAYPGGEMKHGPIALIDKNFPLIFVAPIDSVYEKILLAMEEARARNGKIISITTQGNKSLEKLSDDIIYIPKTLEILSPILTVIPLHLFAAYMGLEMGYDIDKPRNLAKSVTVE